MLILLYVINISYSKLMPHVYVTYTSLIKYYYSIILYHMLSTYCFSFSLE